MYCTFSPFSKKWGKYFFLIQKVDKNGTERQVYETLGHGRLATEKKNGSEGKIFKKNGCAIFLGPLGKSQFYARRPPHSPQKRRSANVKLNPDNGRETTERQYVQTYKENVDRI